MKAGKRGTTEILADILRAARDADRKTNIIRQANTNHLRGTAYLEACLTANLLRRRNERYSLTEKGSDLLEHWGEVEQLLPHG